MRHRALAIKCRMKSFGGTLRSPSKTQSCLMVENPTVAMVNSPTHLQLTTAPRARPVRVSQVHQASLNGSPLSFSAENPIQKYVERAVKNMRGESRRMSRDWVTKPFSKVTKREPSSAVVARQSRARSVKYVTGTSATPRLAGNNRITT